MLSCTCAGRIAMSAVTAVVVVIVLVVAGAPNAVADPMPASTYAGTAHNTTFNISAPFRLTGVTLDPLTQRVTGQFTVDAPLYGSGPFDGFFAHGEFPFTIRSTQPNPCACQTISVLATVDAAGVLTGTYTTVAGGQTQQGTLTASPAGAPVAAPAAPTAPLPPAFGTGGVFVLPPTHTCVSRRHFRIRIHRQRAGITLISAAVAVNGRRVAVRKGRRLSAPVDLRGLPKGRFTVRISALTSDGRAITGSRRYRTCAPKGASSAPGTV